MKTIFNEAEKNEILQRIEKLTAESKPLWGIMNVSQMLAHCSNALKMPTGELKTKRAGFPLNILGPMVKSVVLGEKPFRKNTTTPREIKVTDTREFDKEKNNLIAAVRKFAEHGEKSIQSAIHPFFGKMTPAEWGRLNYKHTDHHLSQFGV